MKPVRRGSRVAICIACAGIAVTVAATIAARPLVLEAWYLRRLDSKDLAVKSAAVRALGELRSARAIPGIIDSFGESLEHVPGDGPHPAEPALGKIGLPAVPLLIETLGRPGLSAWHAARALAFVGRAAVPGVRIALRSEQQRTRLYAAFALQNLGPDAGEAVPDLLELLGDTDAEVRANAAIALGNSERDRESPEVVAALGRLLQSDATQWVRRRAALALGTMGSGARGAIPALTDALKDEDVATREAATGALKAIRGR